VIDGRLPALQVAKTTFEDLAALYLQDYAINHRKSAQRARELAENLGKAFNRFRAHAITSPRIGEYIAKRQADAASNATINRELTALKRMFRLAAQQTPPLVLITPYIPHLREDNVRTGFFTEEEYRVLRAALPDHLKIPFIIAYHTGMRAGEIHWLRWEQVDLEAGWVRLDPGMTKNGRGRMIPLIEEVRDALKRWKEHTLLYYPACPWIVHYRGKRLQRVQKKLWDKICDRVGLLGKLFHDLRRTAIRNMVRAGIPERVAMEISGHKTRSVFDRYDIVDENDLFEAAICLQKSHEFK
jgi:integrase